MQKLYIRQEKIIAKLIYFVNAYENEMNNV